MVLKILKNSNKDQEKGFFSTRCSKTSKIAEHQRNPTEVFKLFFVGGQIKLISLEYSVLTIHCFKNGKKYLKFALQLLRRN